MITYCVLLKDNHGVIRHAMTSGSPIPDDQITRPDQDLVVERREIEADKFIRAKELLG